MNFIKKLLKYILILAVIVAVAGAAIGIAVYYWEKNEDKKEQQLNQKIKEKSLVFFTNEGYIPARFHKIKWAVINNKYTHGTSSFKTNWERGDYQKGFDENGKLIFRDIHPWSKIAFYYADEIEGLFVLIIWLESCKPNSEAEYKMPENNTTFHLRCSSEGQYLYTSFRTPAFDFSSDVKTFNLNAGGFTFYVDTRPFNMNLLLKNKTMLQVGNQ